MWKCPYCQRKIANVEQSHFCEKIHTVDEYIAGCPAEVRPILHAIRQTIREAAPEAVEKIAWRMPTFWDGENIVHFAAHMRHISLYPGGEATAAFADRLTKYKTSKGAVQFPLGMAIDHALIADIVRWRMEQAKNETPAEAESAVKPRYAMPDYIAAALERADLQARYDARPALPAQRLYRLDHRRQTRGNPPKAACPDAGRAASRRRLYGRQIKRDDTALKHQGGPPTSVRYLREAIGNSTSYDEEVSFQWALQETMLSQINCRTQ